MPLAANVLESMNSDRRWGTSPALQPLNDAPYHAGRHVERHVGRHADVTIRLKNEFYLGMP